MAKEKEISLPFLKIKSHGTLKRLAGFPTYFNFRFDFHSNFK